MKQFVTVTLLSFLFLNVIAQKDSTKDTIAILSLSQVREIANDIQIQATGKAEIKREIWDEVLDVLSKSIIVRTLPNKERNSR